MEPVWAPAGWNGGRMFDGGGDVTGGAKDAEDGALRAVSSGTG